MCLASWLIYYPLLEFAGEECLYTKYWLVGALPVYSVCTDSILILIQYSFDYLTPLGPKHVQKIKNLDNQSPLCRALFKTNTLIEQSFVLFG